MDTNLALPFYNNARSHPERLALSVSQRDFSYGELAETTARIASWLRARSSGEAKLVGILASRSWLAYAGILAACWTGAPYVPLNPDWPEQRLLSILATSGLDTILVDDRGLKLLSPNVLQQGVKHILACCDSSLPANVRITSFNALPNPDPHPPASLTASDLAYVMFTSGTTGTPKGVMVSTGNVTCFISAMQELYPFSSEDRVSQTYDLTFDPSVMDMFTTWRSGASLHVVPAGQLMGPSRFIRDHQLTCWFSVPSTIAFMRNMKMLTPGAFPSVRYSIFCGEPLPAASAELWQCAAPNSLVDNLYGPTEATVVCIGQRCTTPMIVTEGRGTVAIGKPFGSNQAAIVDSSLHFLRAGEKGELALCGNQIAQGYFNDPQKTAARFPTIDGKRWYLTGDFAYQDSEGRFHHLGRTDNQVKVLGNRVELEDVEAHLREVCAVDSVAAVAWPITNAIAEGIVAFVAGSSLPAVEIREKMQRRVPKYMVPTEIRFLPRLPLSVAGKTDRKTLTLMLSEGSQ